MGGEDARPYSPCVRTIRPDTDAEHSGPRSAVGRALSTASYLAAWPALYMLGAVACCAQVAGIHGAITSSAAIRAAAFTACTTIAVYLLDRVKLRQCWLDPADAAAHPMRFAFVARHGTPLRLIVLTLLIAGTWLGSELFAWGAAIPVLAAIGVFLYAGRPRSVRSRPKDVLLVKNAYVAVGIAGFSVVVAVAAMRPGATLAEMGQTASEYALPLALSALLLAIRVLADAILCDLDDEDADRRFGTDTLPNQVGRARAWNIAIAIRLFLAGVLLVTPVLPFWPRVAWAAVTAVTSAALRLASPVRVRDLVDVRLAVEAAVVAGVLLLIRGGT